MATLHLTRGLPASGKTTHARQWVAEDPTSRARVNRDDLRAMLHDGVWRGQATETQIIAVRDRAIASLLRRGIDVICDDTNLPQDTAKDLAKLAQSEGASLAVVDLTAVPLDECLRRDGLRPKPVGEDVIRTMHAKFLSGGRRLAPVVAAAVRAPAAVKYTPPLGGLPAILCDIDGTLALANGRDPYDEARVGDDLPNVPVVAAVHAMSAQGFAVVCMSGRTAGCRAETMAWLERHGIRCRELLMREVGDKRKDSIVKAELFDRHVRDKYAVRCVFDDRNQVVEMWRSLGLTCFQVAPGDF